MAKYRIAWLPGEGIGVDVLEAAEAVLDKIELVDAGGLIPDTRNRLLEKAEKNFASRWQMSVSNLKKI